MILKRIEQNPRGRIADMLANEHDLDSYDVDPSAIITSLQSERQYAVEVFERELNEKLASAKAVIDSSAERLETLEEIFGERKLRAERARSEMTEWARLGLRASIGDASSGWAKWMVIAFLTLADLYLFARAIALINDVRIHPAELEFWTGASFGLIISLVALLVGQSLKHSAMAFAQRSIVADASRSIGKTRANGGQPMRIALPRPASPRLVRLSFWAILFVAIIGAMAWIRISADVDESLAMTAFQMLIPLVIVGVEFRYHDPMQVSEPQRSREHRKLKEQVSGLSQESQRIVDTRESSKAELLAAYTAEHDSLVGLLRDSGLEPLVVESHEVPLGAGSVDIDLTPDAQRPVP